VTLTIYGIRNCDTMKTARAWLDARGVDYVFHDYKKAGIDRARLERWVAAVGWEQLVNRAGTTFRKLPDAAKAGLDESRAIALMLAQPSLIKRPVLEWGPGNDPRLLIGFKPDAYAAAQDDAARRGGR
jgi:arsenate reductase